MILKWSYPLTPFNFSKAVVKVIRFGGAMASLPIRLDNSAKTSINDA